MYFSGKTFQELADTLNGSFSQTIHDIIGCKSSNLVTLLSWNTWFGFATVKVVSGTMKETNNSPFTCQPTFIVRLEGNIHRNPQPSRPGAFQVFPGNSQ